MAGVRVGGKIPPTSPAALDNPTQQLDTTVSKPGLWCAQRRDFLSPSTLIACAAASCTRLRGPARSVEWRVIHPHAVHQCLGAAARSATGRGYIFHSSSSEPCTCNPRHGMWASAWSAVGKASLPSSTLKPAPVAPQHRGCRYGALKCHMAEKAPPPVPQFQVPHLQPHAQTVDAGLWSALWESYPSSPALPLSVKGLKALISDWWQGFPQPELQQQCKQSTPTVPRAPALAAVVGVQPQLPAGKSFGAPDSQPWPVSLAAIIAIQAGRGCSTHTGICAQGASSLALLAFQAACRQLFAWI